MLKEVKPVENGIVTRSNKLIEARYKLSLHEQKVIYSIISQIQPNDNDFNIVRFKISELANFCGIPANNANRDLEEVTRTLLTRVLTFKDEKKTRQTHWVQAAEYEQGTVTFELDANLKPYLLGLKAVFTSMKVSELMSFKSQYSGRIYELLYQYLSFGKREFTLSEFKLLLGLDNKAYPLFGHIKARIIEPAVKDINKNTPMSVSYETEKTGTKVTGLIFRMEIKKDSPAASETNPLIQIGIDEKTAAALIQKYSSARIAGNLAHALQQTGVKKLAAYAIRAIEKDYAEIEEQSLVTIAAKQEEEEKKKTAEEIQKQALEEIERLADQPAPAESTFAERARKIREKNKD